MASLLDIFGGSSGDLYGGLLGEEGLAQAKRQAQADALMNLSTSLLKAGAPSRTPQGLGLGLMEGMQAASKGYKSAMDTAVQERLTQQKIAEALASKQRQAGAKQLLQTALQPQQVTSATAGPGGVPYPVTAGFQTQSLQDLIPQFAKYGTEGFEALKQYTELQKAARPETVTLSEGQQVFERTPEGYKSIAGAPKVQRLSGEESNIALRLFGTNDPAELQKIPGASNAIANAAVALKKAGATSINMPSESERKAATLANRMNFSVQQMNQAIGADPTAAMPNTAAEAARFLTRTDFIANALTPEQRQIVETAQLDVLDAALTLGTGAAYTREQLEGYRKSYFPQLNDNPQTIKSKQARLQNLLDSAEVAAGRAKGSITAPKPAPVADTTPVTITLPNGQKATFKSKADADAFRKEAGF